MTLPLPHRSAVINYGCRSPGVLHLDLLIEFRAVHPGLSFFLLLFPLASVLLLPFLLIIVGNVN